MQWMIITSFVPSHALHAPQHAAASPFGPLNHSNDFFRPSCRIRLYITGTGKSRYAGFCLELKKVITGILDYPSPGEIEIKISRLFFQTHAYLFRRRNESCCE